MYHSLLIISPWTTSNTDTVGSLRKEGDDEDAKENVV